MRASERREMMRNPLNPFRPFYPFPLRQELLAKHYGFTEEELDFIINYDIKYRMGDELNAGE